MAATDPKWRQFEKAIQTIFERNPKAKVHRDAEVTGASGRTRKLELLVEYPFEVAFGEGFAATIPITIAVDCKDHARRIDINLVDQFFGQMDDIGAHLGIMVATRGFDAGAEARAKVRNIFLIHATWDLMRLAEGLSLPDLYDCRVCREALGKDADTSYGVVAWNPPRAIEGSPTSVGVVLGACNKCGTDHVFCPDCGAVTGFCESDLDECIECAGECGRVYVLTEVHPRYLTRQFITFGHVERAVIETAWKRKGRIAPAEAEKIIRASKWRYDEMQEYGPVWMMGEEGWISHEEDEKGETVIELTEEGRQFAEKYLAHARMSDYEW